MILSVLIVAIDFPGGKCNLKINIRREKGIKEKFIYVSLLKCNIFRMKIQQEYIKICLHVRIIN